MIKLVITNIIILLIYILYAYYIYKVSVYCLACNRYLKRFNLLLVQVVLLILITAVKVC